MFHTITAKYKEFYNSLLRQGKLPVRDTNKGIWGVTPDGIYEIFKQLKLQNFRNFIDIGSGDGKVALIASLFTNSTGIEADKELTEEAIEIRDSLNLKCNLLCDDFFNHNLSKYDLIYINPDQNFVKLEQKLLREFKGVVLVYNDIFKPRFLKIGKIYWLDQIPVTEYSVEKRNLFI